MENIIGFVGSFLKHVVGVLLLCWRRMLRAGIVAFGIGFVLALLVAVIGTGQAFPGALAVVVAAIFGAALGYGVALTVLVEEFVLGVIDMLHMLEGDVEKVAHITEAVAEREAGDITQGLRRLIGLPVSGATPRATASAPTLTVPRTPTNPARAAALDRAATAGRLTSTAIEAAGVIGAALAARAATTAPQAAAPESPAAPTGEPVPADRLPRITWTYEHEAVKPPTPSATPLAEAAGAALAAGAGAAEAEHLTQPEPPPAPEPEPTPTPEPVIAPEPAPTPYVAENEAPLEDEPLATPTFDDEPAPATVPLPQAEDAAPASLLAPDALPLLDPALIAPHVHTEAAETAVDAAPYLDPAMLTAAPATTPLIHNDDHTAPEPAAAPDMAMGAPAPATTPLAQDAEPEQAPEPESAAAEVMTPLAVAPESAPAEPESAAPATDEPQSARSTYGRVTQPLEDMSAAFDRINRAGTPTNPRLSAPESGLWERLSQALIDRAGAPSGPFAAPQTSRGNEPPAAPPADAPASEADETPRD